MTDTLTAHLQALEESLLDPEVRRDALRTSALLTEDFREFGSSGRVYHRAQIIQALATEAPVHLQLSNAECQLVAPGVALLTYVSTRYVAGCSPQRALRSSLWVLREGHWVMRFHQGTPTQVP